MIRHSARRLICSLLILGTLGFFSTPTASSAESEKVTHLFEVIGSELKDARRDRYTTDVRLMNLANETIAGPIVLVVKETGVEGLKLKSADGKLADGTPFITVVESKKGLPPGKETKRQRIQFEGNEKVTDEAIVKFKLVADVYRISEDNQRVAGTNPQGRSVAGNNRGGIPLGNGNSRPSGQPQSSQNPGEGTPSSEPSTAPMPEPDPAFSGKTASTTGEQSKRPLPTKEQTTLALKTKKVWGKKLIEINGVHSVGAAYGTEGGAVIRVRVEEFDQKKLVPETVGGVPVEVIVCEPDKYYQNDNFPAGNRAHLGIYDPDRQDGNCTENPRRRFNRPVPIGISSFNQDTAICASGTLGCRLRRPDGTVYALSNSHVYGESGGATAGDLIIQPSTGDINCAIIPGDVIGTLFDFTVENTGGFNLLDAAVAQVSEMTVGMATPCDGYGVPSSTTVLPELGMRVLKYGRTTGFTTSMIVELDVLANVSGALYDGQIGFSNDGIFGAPGDSGSLIVTQSGRHPVSLLFAGSAVRVLGNPINDVLIFFGMTIDGQ